KAHALYALGRFEEASSVAEECARLQTLDASARDLRSFMQRALRRTIPDRVLTLRDGRRLAYLDYGDAAGFPILCCHGTPGSRLDFAVYGTPLDEVHVRLIVPDRPGYGCSEAKRTARLLDWPDDVAQLADHLGLARFAVLGVSGGGPFAAACAYKLAQ